MQLTKTIKATILASVLAAGSAQALPFVSIEAGGIIGASFDSVKKWDIGAHTAFSYGAYARVWLKPGIFRIAPFVKWENISGISLNSIPGMILQPKASENNVQYGGLVGIEFFNITPYAGVSYSQFTGDTNLQDTWAFNYGIKVKIPVIFLTVGLDGSYQKPKINSSADKIEMHRIGATLGFQF